MAASFSGKAKAEICKIFPQKRCCALAQCFGILLFCNTFGAEGIRIITESAGFAQLLPKLFKKAFGISFDVSPEPQTAGKMVFQITDLAKLNVIMEAYGFTASDTLAVHINLPVVEEECCKTSFLRGAFLARGFPVRLGKFHLMQKSLKELHARTKSAHFSIFCVRKSQLVFRAEFITECRLI